MGVMCLPDNLYKKQVTTCVAQDECTGMCTGSKGNCDVDEDKVAGCDSSKCKDNSICGEGGWRVASAQLAAHRLFDDGSSGGEDRKSEDSQDKKKHEESKLEAIHRLAKKIHDEVFGECDEETCYHNDTNVFHAVAKKTQDHITKHTILIYVGFFVAGAFILFFMWYWFVKPKRRKG